MSAADGGRGQRVLERHSIGLGDAVRALRAARALTQSELAHRAALHRNTVGLLERGASPNPNLAAVSRLAYGLGVSVRVLIVAYVWPDGAGVASSRSREDDAVLRGRALTGAEGSPTGSGPVGMGIVVQALRSEAGLSVTTLAALGAVRPDFVADLEAGRAPRPGLRTLLRVARALGGGRRSDLAATEVRLSLLARVFAGELSAHDLERAGGLDGHFRSAGRELGEQQHDEGGPIA